VYATSRAHLEAEGAQVIGHDLRGPLLAVPELGVLVEVAAPRHRLREDGVGPPIDLGVERGQRPLGRRGRGGEESREQGEGEREQQHAGASDGGV